MVLIFFYSHISTHNYSENNTLFFFIITLYSFKLFIDFFFVLVRLTRITDNIITILDEELLQILKDLKMELAEEKHHLKETVFKPKPASTKTTQIKPVPMPDDEDTPKQQLTQKKPQLNAEATQETQDSKESRLTDGKRDSRTGE